VELWQSTARTAKLTDEFLEHIMKFLVFLAAMTGSPLLADIEDAVQIDGCAFVDSVMGEGLNCDVTNLSDTAIAKIGYAFLITQEGRSVAWMDTRGDNSRRNEMQISGGLEPGETFEASFLFIHLSERADRSKVDVSVIPTFAIDWEGNTIE
jgi:hypothetical protein